MFPKYKPHNIKPIEILHLPLVGWMGNLKKLSRSTRPEVLCKKEVLRNFSKFTGKHLCQSLFFNKLQA